MTDAIADPRLADVYRDALLALLPEPLSIWEFAGEEVRVTRYRWNGEGWLISVVDETGKPITVTHDRFFRNAVIVRDPEPEGEPEGEQTREELLADMTQMRRALTEMYQHRRAAEVAREEATLMRKALIPYREALDIAINAIDDEDVLRGINEIMGGDDDGD